MEKKTQKKEYDMVQRNRAITGLGLRVVVSAYIVYLAWKILTGMISGSSPIPTWAVLLICIVLTGVALVFCVYSWKSFRKALKAAEYSAVPESKDIKKTDVQD